MGTNSRSINSFKYEFFAYFIYLLTVLTILSESYANIETYETLLSALTAQEYYPISKDFLLFDSNMFIMPIIAWFNSFAPGVQLYGYYLFIITVFIGVLYIRLIFAQKKLNNESKIYLTAVFLILHILNLLFLSTVRVSVLALFLFFILYHQNQISKIKLLILFILNLILRIDALVLLSTLYLGVSILMDKKIKSKQFIPFFASLFCLALYNQYVSNFSSEPYQALYYYEMDLLDRSNINFNQISPNDSIPLMAAKQLLIFDKEIFDTHFIKSILIENSSHLTNTLFNPKLYLNTIVNSLPEIKKFWDIILLVILSFVIRKLHGLSIKPEFILLFFFPLAICLYTSLPSRFIYPYYSIFLILVLAEVEIKKKFKYALLILISTLVTIHISQRNPEYQMERSLFLSSIDKAKKISSSTNQIQYFENMYGRSWRFTTPDLNYRYQNNKFHFLNLWFWQGFDNYTQKWENEGCKNPLSIYSKIKHIHNQGSKLIFDNKDFHTFYKEYMNKQYQYTDSIDAIYWQE